jgi:propane monooxygenase large subunit
MGRFSGRREWETCYHGWDLADAIEDLGFVRTDGKTLIPQPHLRFDPKEMWTLDDVRGHTLMSPLTLLREMSDEDREAHVAEYKAGFEINPCN